MSPISFRFSNEETQFIRRMLLSWYDGNKRDLPWRISDAASSDCHAYSVWVSEIMLQQTRVATVIDFYKRWMQRWPDIASLSKSTEEEVNEVWSGLGYYSRGRRLREGAIKVNTKLDNVMPRTRIILQKELPGVGRYTASAISSIAFKEAVGVLDGNVTRVLCRLRCIGGNSVSKGVTAHLWQLADDIVDAERPGDFNQAMMELGATVCLPTNPKCSACPVKSVCQAYQQVQNYDGVFRASRKSVEQIKVEEGVLPESFARKPIPLKSRNQSALSQTDCKTEGVLPEPDIENCAEFLSLPKTAPWKPELGVMNYPRKPAKKAPRIEHNAVAAVEVLQDTGQKSSLRKDSKWLIVQRPNSGLLAGLWEFPNRSLPNSSAKDDVTSASARSHADEILAGVLNGAHRVVQRRHLGELVHIFSHIRQVNHVVHVQVDVPVEKLAFGRRTRLVTAEELKNSAISASVLKMYKLCCKSTENRGEVASLANKKRKRGQLGLECFFTKKVKQ